MLTLDDLDHFDDPGMAHLFASAASGKDVDSMARLARILACLNFCRNIPDDELTEGGLHAARRAVNSVLRGQQRKRRLDPAQLAEALEGAQRALGAPRAQAEPADAAPERHAVEAEIQAAACKLSNSETADTALRDALADGDFEILASSNLATLTAPVAKSAGAPKIEVALAVDDNEGPTALLRVHLVVENSYWRWTAHEGCWLSRNGGPPIFMAADDAIVQALLAGLALRGGRPLATWANAVREHALTS